MKSFLFILMALLGMIIHAQGPYAPPVGQVGSTAIHKDSSIFQAWATTCELVRGWQNCADTTLGKATIGDSLSPIGTPAANGIVSFGDAGIATLTFNGFIYDGPGADFAVFENSFDGMFLELAFVEVSSNGIDFVRFDAVSLTQNTTQLGNDAQMDATNIHNLAGKYRAGYGTPFDLSELAGVSGLDISKITHIRVIDVIGNINPPFASYDSQSNIINDPYPTPFPSGGFDLDAVGVIHFSPTSIDEYSNNLFSVYPNPCKDIIHIKSYSDNLYDYMLIDVYGKVVISKKQQFGDLKIDVSAFPSGIYLLSYKDKNGTQLIKLLKGE